MKYLPLIWAQLWRKPTRTALTFLALVTAFMLFGLLQGIRVGFDVMAQSGRQDVIYTGPAFGAPVPVTYAEQIAKIEGVKNVAAMTGLGGYYQDPKNGVGVTPTDERYFEIQDQPPVTKEQIAAWNEARDGLIIGSGIAKRFELKVGDPMTIHTSNMAMADGNRDFLFHISAIVDDPANPETPPQFMVGHFDYVNELRVQGKDRVITIAIRISDPKDSVRIMRAIDGMFVNSAGPTMSRTERAGSQASIGGFGNISLFVNTIVAAVLFMILFITANTLMLAFNERMPELAVLKTLGFGDNAVAGLVIGEALMQCVLGAIAGLLLSKVAMPFLHGKLPLPPRILITPWSVTLVGLVVAILLAVISGILPAWRAKQITVVNALAVR